MNSRCRATIRSHLTWLVVSCVVPVWLVAGILVLHAYSTKRDHIDRDMLEKAHAITMVVDREVSRTQAALQALATSPAFATADFGAIHRQALELLPTYPGADIIVADATGQQLVNSYRPYGEPLPKRKDPETVQRIFKSGKPVVSDLFFGAVTKHPLIGIDVPVFQNGVVVYDLAMTFPSDRLSSIMTDLKLPTGWYASLIDSRKVVVSRTRHPERFIGAQTSPALSDVMASVAEGTAEYTNFEGTPVFGAFTRSWVSNWSVLIAVPKVVVMAEVYRWMGWAIGSSAAISFIGVLVAMRIARRIARDIQALVDPALSIGRGELVTAIDDLHVRETGEVAAALVRASELLQHRAGKRDAAEQLLSRTVELLQNETAERVRATEALLEKERQLIQQGRHAAMGEMIGNIAHQWRQPLNTLGLKVQHLLMLYDYGEFNRDVLEKNINGSMELIQYMSDTIDYFRNYFRPDNVKAEFNAHEAIKNALSLLEGSFEEPKISTEIVMLGDPVIYGFPNEFAQVSLNILINARDAFIERNIDDAKVTITICREDGNAVVTISDNAGGIPEDIIGKIFDPYFTTKGPQQGTGVGLFMSKAIIEQSMAGTLAVRNTADGAEFRMAVPAYEDIVN